MLKGETDGGKTSQLIMKEDLKLTRTVKMPAPKQ